MSTPTFEELLDNMLSLAQQEIAADIDTTEGSTFTQFYTVFAAQLLLNLQAQTAQNNSHTLTNAQGTELDAAGEILNIPRFKVPTIVPDVTINGDSATIVPVFFEVKVATTEFTFGSTEEVTLDSGGSATVDFVFLGDQNLAPEVAIGALTDIVDDLSGTITSVNNSKTSENGLVEDPAYRSALELAYTNLASGWLATVQTSLKQFTFVNDVQTRIGNNTGGTTDFASKNGVTYELALYELLVIVDPISFDGGQFITDNSNRVIAEELLDKVTGLVTFYDGGVTFINEVELTDVVAVNLQEFTVIFYTSFLEIIDVIIAYDLNATRLSSTEESEVRQEIIDYIQSVPLFGIIYWSKIACIANSKSATLTDIDIDREGGVPATQDIQLFIDEKGTSTFDDITIEYL